MTPDEMFKQYRLLNPMANDYSHAIFSDYINFDDILSDKISSIIIPAFIFEECGEEVPLKDDIEVFTDNKGSAIALLKITETEIAPYFLFDKEKSPVIGKPQGDDIVIKVCFKLIFY